MTGDNAETRQLNVSNVQVQYISGDFAVRKVADQIIDGGAIQSGF